MLRYTTQLLKRPLSQQCHHNFSTSTVVGSHIGRTPIYYPQEVTLDHDLTPIQFPRIPSELNNTTLTVKGPLGQLQMPIKPFIKLDSTVGNNEGSQESVLQVNVKDATIKEQRAMWGTTRNLIRNMIVGVSEGYRLHLRLVGVGYRGVLENNNRSVSLKLGYSHPVVIDLPEGITCTIPQPNRLILQGIDLQQVTELAAKIQQWRKPEPYNQKGIFINDETIKKKEGKKK
ncbi:ribosomal protein L6, alpha-beta domain-containing protein [Halteromyces radiatus]|uniref:ribosomal protein L6, alpha-beta domain-containing protein n=1 Tax=Halteromyces radiatus TaxID=101107 RepID=UPI00221FBBD5|nr:ribosomal protein L6, alpha-beta domain-containing protein [Halteromyces radiatus]KAI8082962.1 ribosomal protein L6, alpha-beta domain-containing protein [Halteromyces radiatus]